MSVNPVFIDFCNKLARVESIEPSSFHKEACSIMNTKNLSEALYELKSKAIEQGIPSWRQEGRKVSVTRYRYIKNFDYIFVVEVKTLDEQKTFRFHFFDWKGEYVANNNIHHPKSDENKKKTNLPFSNLDWLHKLVSEVQ